MASASCEMQYEGVFSQAVRLETTHSATSHGAALVWFAGMVCDTSCYFSFEFIRRSGSFSNAINKAITLLVRRMKLFNVPVVHDKKRGGLYANPGCVTLTIKLQTGQWRFKMFVSNLQMV